MADHKSAKKRARQTIKKTEQNKSRRTEIRGIIKKIRLAISEKDKDTALSLLPKIQRNFARLAQTGIIKKNNAARKTSRLASQITKL